MLCILHDIYYMILYILKIHIKDRKCWSCGHYSVDLWFCSVTKNQNKIKIKMNFPKGIKYIIADDTCF